ncbi:MAG: helix-turn-helix domain-containing protein [Oscillospiraceae bacterium]|nr:helix-turn-helix domain-containing protein [Oscillospiraceae bacterium]
MSKQLFLLAEKIKSLRDGAGLTQSELSRTLGLTRSSVNAWEMGLSVPSTQYVVELAKTFKVSTDYLLGMEAGATIPVNGLSQKQISVLVDMIRCFQTEE